MAQQPITLIGGGLVGALLAQQLAQRGFAVEVYEKRPDPRLTGFLGGRSINLALAERGLQALRTAGLADDVLLGHQNVERGSGWPVYREALLGDAVALADQFDNLVSDQFDAARAGCCDQKFGQIWRRF